MMENFKLRKRNDQCNVRIEIYGKPFPADD